MLIGNYFNDNLNLGFVLWHQKASRRTIAVRDHDKKGLELYYLSFPPILFSIEYTYYVGWNEETQFKVGFIPSKISDRAKVYLPPMPNTDIDCEVCLGGDVNRNRTVEGLANKTIQNFWTRTFLFGEMNYALNQYLVPKRKEMANIHWWAEQTKKNKKWVPSRKHLVYYGTVKSFLGFSLKDHKLEHLHE